MTVLRGSARLVGAMKSVACLALLLGSVVSAHAAPPPSTAERALMEAAFDGELEQVRHLVSEGASVNAADGQDRVPLMWAAFNGHTPVIAYLLEEGAKLDARDSAGRTALMYASSGPFADTVELLLDKGADANVQGTLEGFTALMTAAAEGQLEVVRLLLAHGADRKIEDQDGDTAESFARQKGHADVVELLRKAPADADRP